MAKLFGLQIHVCGIPYGAKISRLKGLSGQTDSNSSAKN